MSELEERGWAVMSERGREAAGLIYAEALELERSLANQKISGLCIVTDKAASHLPPAKQKGGEAVATDTHAASGNAEGASTRRRAARRKSTS
jgi:hypothetical protein